MCIREGERGNNSRKRQKETARERERGRVATNLKGVREGEHDPRKRESGIQRVSVRMSK